MGEFDLIKSLIILLPLFGAVIIGLVGYLNEGFRKAEGIIGAVATLMVAIPFVIIAKEFITMLGSESPQPQDFVIFKWMWESDADSAMRIAFGYRLDQLSLLMGMIVTGVGSLIHVYSIGYMHGDRSYYKFFMYLNLFIFAMLNLILGDNMAVTFLGWEGVGACSYFLIGFWYEDMSKSKAAQKAFIANRIGDFAMLAAMMIVYFKCGGTLKYSSIDVAALGDYTGWVALLVFIAATGKSAQIPLFVWLPDAMAGPTPVSALIHAATMVTSGIYLISRMSDVFVASPEVMTLVCFVGAATAMMAAMIAIAQNDIKGVLAYSTVSQLGFMFMALGAGAFGTAIFHVMTHAFFKACLFLGSGSVIHAMEHMHTVKDPQDIRTMGGLKKYMPATRITFLISTLAISGIPLLSGFFSKDEILGKVFANAAHGHYIYYLMWGVGVITAAMTAFYMTRVYFLTFEGEERFPSEKKPHESPALMTIPLYVLGGLALVGGYVGLPEVFSHGHWNWINHHWLYEGAVNSSYISDMHVSIPMEWTLILLSSAIAIGGVYFAWSFFTKNDLEGDSIIREKLGKFYSHMQGKFYVDELYDMVIIKPFVKAGEEVVMWFDINVIDGMVNGAGRLVLALGDGLKRLQTGLTGHYALMMVIGVISILTYLIFG